MDLSNGDLAQQRAEADRREVDPPIQVQTAEWSKAGQLDWWVKERREGWDVERAANLASIDVTDAIRHAGGVWCQRLH